ncbi:glycoside hydrolase family 3 N-terminal domain-containing protein [Devosia sp.]|uniref:glycoside hydrolase family 3 N-terminal domain-containing protein n=1 Tax=Devosia sp. TaxID=1871048 RepID=UPI003A946BB0
MAASPPLALFVGMPGLELSPSEMAFFREANPLGLFLFRRNLETPDQIRRLCAQFRDAVGRADAPIYIDQEGGRVQRLDAGSWPAFRSFGEFGALAQKDLELGKHALRLSSLAMGAMMRELTLDSGTTPILDLSRADTHGVIGNRSFGSDPDLVALLGRVVMEAMLEVGAMPIIKHVPGYGRVSVDPHFDCPVVDASLEEMWESDFRPFMALRDAPFAMVAHLIFSRIDPDRPASVSPILHGLIRDELGFEGVLITDCVTMEALSGPWPDRVKAALDAGYDIALHSQGDLAASLAAAEAARPLSALSLERLARAEARRGSSRCDVMALHAQVEQIFIDAGFV